MPATVQLDHDQIRNLWEALLAAFGSRSQFQQMLFLRTGHELSQISSDNANLRDAVYAAVMEAQREGWIVDLVEGAHQHSPAQPALREFVAHTFPDRFISLAGDSGVNIDPLSACFLSADRRRVFIDRRQLRNGLRELTGPGLTPRILTVHSDLSRCGKTYTAEFIRFVALHRQDRVAYVDLREEISLGSGLQELMEQLGRKLRVDITTIPQQEAQTARWTRNLVLWLIDQINRSEHFWWLVFDSIDQVDGIPSEIEDFIARLARQLEIEEYNPRCRLVLLSYEGRKQLPLEIRHLIVQDEIDQEIGLDQLRRFFEEQIQNLLGEDGDEDQVHDVAVTLCEVVKARLEALPEEARPYAISSVVRDALRELEASLVEEAP